jgi:hypothetical protein
MKELRFYLDEISKKEYIVWGRKKGESGGLKSGIATVDNYNIKTLRKLAKNMNLDSIRVDIPNYNKYGKATLFVGKTEPYQIWQDGEQLFYSKEKL